MSRQDPGPGGSTLRSTHSCPEPPPSQAKTEGPQGLAVGSGAGYGLSEGFWKVCPLSGPWFPHLWMMDSDLISPSFTGWLGTDLKAAQMETQEWRGSEDSRGGPGTGVGQGLRFRSKL